MEWDTWPTRKEKVRFFLEEDIRKLMFCLLPRSLNVICAGWRIWVVSAHGPQRESHSHGKGGCFGRSLHSQISSSGFCIPMLHLKSSETSINTSVTAGEKKSGLFYLRRHNLIKRRQQTLFERWTNQPFREAEVLQISKQAQPLIYLFFCLSLQTYTQQLDPVQALGTPCCRSRAEAGIKF